MSGEFEQLQSFKWKGIEVPVSTLELSYGQDIAEHKYYGVDGARLEGTGRGPIRIRASIPFRNGIVPGKNESWAVLYPNVFRQFAQVTSKGTTGVLHHPDFGDINCKVQSVHFNWDPHKRDGVDAECEWLETIVDENEANFFNTQSPVANAEIAALDLDASKDDIKKLAPPKQELGFDVGDFIDSLTAFSDSIGRTLSAPGNTINHFIYKLNRLKDSLNRTKSALAWPAIDACERAQSALQWLKDHPPSPRPVLIHVVGADIALAALLDEIPGALFGDIVALNPGIMSEPVVRQGTRVRYYAPR